MNSERIEGSEKQMAELKRFLVPWKRKEGTCHGNGRLEGADREGA
jgi:hypothetical protein